MDHPQRPTALPMKHLDSIDGVVGAVPTAERPPTSMLGDNIELLILRLRMPDAETWIAHTATKRVLQLGEEPIRDYLLISNGLRHRTPCTFTICEESIDWVDDPLLDQLAREGIGLTDMSTIYVATAQLQCSYADVTWYITQF